MVQVYWRNEIFTNCQSMKISWYDIVVICIAWLSALQHRMQESCNQNRNARNMQYCLPSPYLNMILFSSAVGIVMDFLAKQRVFSWVFPGGTGPPPAWKYGNIAFTFKSNFEKIILVTCKIWKNTVLRRTPLILNFHPSQFETLSDFWYVLIKITHLRRTPLASSWSSGQAWGREVDPIYEAAARWRASSGGDHGGPRVAWGAAGPALNIEGTHGRSRFDGRDPRRRDALSATAVHWNARERKREQFYTAQIDTFKSLVWVI